ncbi:MAG TPA: hypothetical protein VGM92_08060, partial [Candidatus Kapabacteria bacterium]
MKYLLALLLTLLAANAFASKPDSGICPWKMPFTISIGAMGFSHGYEVSAQEVPGGYFTRDTDYGTTLSSSSLQITVDTTSLYLSDSIQYSLNADILFFSFVKVDPWYHYPTSNILTISFAPGSDSIISLSFSQSYTFMTGTKTSEIHSSTFQILSLKFDDTSIFSVDSSLKKHTIVMTDNQKNDFYQDQFDYHYIYSDFTATSVTLSGIFRTTTFSDPSAAVAAPIANHLEIINSNGSLACSFNESAQERNLKLYSPLGIREASVTIPPNES